MDAIHEVDIVGTGVPHKLFLEILRRLPPSVLSAARRVSRDWRAAVDDNGLLPAGYQPSYSLPPYGVGGGGYHGGRWESTSFVGTRPESELIWDCDGGEMNRWRYVKYKQP